MPRWEEDSRAPGPAVQGFSGGGFSVNGVVYDGVLLTPERAEQWTPGGIADLAIEDFEPLLGITPTPEFLILGTGRSIVFPPRALLRAIETWGVGVEVMDSRAAARTWGIVRGEQRWIVAAIMPLGS